QYLDADGTLDHRQLPGEQALGEYADVPFQAVVALALLLGEALLVAPDPAPEHDGIEGQGEDDDQAENDQPVAVSHGWLLEAHVGRIDGAFLLQRQFGRQEQAGTDVSVDPVIDRLLVLDELDQVTQVSPDIRAYGHVEVFGAVGGYVEGAVGYASGQAHVVQIHLVVHAAHGQIATVGVVHPQAQAEGLLPQVRFEHLDIGQLHVRLGIGAVEHGAAIQAKHPHQQYCQPQTG